MDSEQDQKFSTLEVLQNVSSRLDNIASNVGHRLESLETKYWSLKKADENDFWISIWQIVGAVVCVLIISLTIHSMLTNVKMADMVMAGEDPIAVSCVYGQSREEAATCLTYIANRNSDLKKSK
jgi:hypothetical protein